MALYALELRRTASTTASLGSVTADGTRPRRGEVLYAKFGSEAAPADNAFLVRGRRCTAAGTSTAVTPSAMNPADAATETDAGENHTVEPTYTANSELLLGSFTQGKTTYEYFAGPRGGPIWPATAANGVGFETPTSSASTIYGMVHFWEY